MRGDGLTSSVQQTLAARLEARLAMIMAQHARRAAQQAPGGPGSDSSRLVLIAAEQASQRAERRLREASRRIDLIA
jgi:hypothetical protein